jgi:hypothetical protein
MPSYCELTGTLPRTRARGESSSGSMESGQCDGHQSAVSHSRAFAMCWAACWSKTCTPSESTHSAMPRSGDAQCFPGGLYHWPKPRRRLQREAQTRGEAGGCHWQYQADIVCTSGKSHIPTETSTGSNSPVTLMTHASYEAQLWNDREYVAGQNGETAPIGTQDHNDFRYEGGVILGCTCSPCVHFIITATPGESFGNSLTPSEPLIGYDPSKGIQAAVLPSARDVQPRQPKHHRHPASAGRSLRCWCMVEFLRRS